MSDWYATHDTTDPNAGLDVRVDYFGYEFAKRTEGVFKDEHARRYPTWHWNVSSDLSNIWIFVLKSSIHRYFGAVLEAAVVLGSVSQARINVGSSLLLRISSFLT